MSNAPFPINPALTAIAIAYRNTRLIADQVLPRVPVGAQEFKYLKHDLAEGFTVPDTKVGRKSRINQVDFSATEETGATQDHGLEAPVPQRDIDNAPANYDPLGKASEQTTNLILLDREVRASNLLFNSANYAAGNKATLSGTSQWSHVDSNPMTAIMDALDSPAFYVGALGSSRTNGARRERLREHFDISEERLGFMSGPIGLDLNTRTASEIALAIMTEITARRNGVELTSKRLTVREDDRTP